LYNSCATVVQGLRDMRWVPCGGFRHMNPRWNPSISLKWCTTVVHQSLLYDNTKRWKNRKEKRNE